MYRFACVLVLVVACGGPSGSSSMTGDDEPMPDAPMMMSLDPADCVGLASGMVAAAQTCGTALPGGAQATFESMCRRGVMAGAMCGAKAAAGLDCLATPDSTDWVCVAGEPYPACNGDLGASLGAWCLMALGNPQCASGVACQFDADCSNGLTCNSATEQCMSETAYCVGLPCQFDADCPNGHTCNSAEDKCIRE
jgi:hypothetical protein